MQNGQGGSESLCFHRKWRKAVAPYTESNLCSCYSCSCFRYLNNLSGYRRKELYVSFVARIPNSSVETEHAVMGKHGERNYFPCGGFRTHNDTARLLYLRQAFSSVLTQSSGPGSVVGIATSYRLDGLGIESRWGGEIFRTSPDRPWGPPSLLYNRYRVFPGGKERPGRDADPSPPSSAVVMKE